MKEKLASSKMFQCPLSTLFAKVDGGQSKLSEKTFDPKNKRQKKTRRTRPHTSTRKPIRGYVIGPLAFRQFSPPTHRHVGGRCPVWSFVREKCDHDDFENWATFRQS